MHCIIRWCQGFSMKRASNLTVALMVLVISAPAATGEEMIFLDDFSHGLSGKWQAIGLKKSDYHVRDGALEMRVQPGKVAHDSPRLAVVLPFAPDESVITS